MSDQLPSIDDFAEDLSKLPSSEEFIKEDLPSVEEFIKKEEEDIVEETIEEPVAEETSGDLTEILHLINAVRRDIPEIPEIKCYDEELKKLTEYIDQVHDCIPEVPEVKYYDNEVEAICEQIDQVREEIKDLPEVKYYDEQVTNIEDRIDLLRQEVVNLPEVKYYDQEIVAICDQIDKVRLEIPKFPKWVNEVNEVPDFTWIGKTFSVIDDDFVKVDDNIKSIRDRINQEVQEIAETLDIKDFENKVEFEKVTTNLKETKDKVYKELREAALGIYDAKKGYKDDDRKLKKQILSQYNKLSQNIEKQLLETKDEQNESNKILTSYFEGLKEEIANLPEPKDYDNPIESLKEDLSKLDERVDGKILNIAELYKIVGELKETQQELKEVYNNRPIQPDPSEKQGNDPLTPTDQKFATLKDLAANYRLFVNRVEQQLYTIGGGGAGFIKDLDDVNIDGLANNDTLVWNASTSKWDVGTVGAGGTWASDSVGVHTTKNVGIATTARSDYALYVEGDGYVTGNWNVTGDIVYDEVSGRNLNISGIATLASAASGVGTVHIGTGSTAMIVDGDARVIGILTVGRSSITLDGSNNIVNVGTGITLNATTGKIMAPEIITSGTTGAFYPPVLNTTQRDALTVTQGAMIFNTSTSKIEFYDGSSWNSVPGVTLGLGMGVF